VLPKPLVPIGDRPILQHLVGQLADSGVTRVDVCVGHLGALIETYFSRTGVPDGVEFALHWEQEPLGTAGALREFDDLEGSFFVLNGDVLTTLNFAELMRYHREQGALLTVAAHRKTIPLELGLIECDAAFITAYREKPTLSYEVSMGIYVYEADVLKYLPREGPFQFPDLVLALIEDGQPVAVYHSDDEWYDIGTVSEYERAARDVEQRGEIYGLPSS
jgi:NDP-sugar pyrophosphorylase family protein